MNHLTDEQWKEYIEKTKELTGEENRWFWEKLYEWVSRPDNDNHDGFFNVQ